MPTIKGFGGCKLVIYCDDHNPPHFHLLAPDWQAKLTIKGQKLLKGEYRTNAAKVALAWAKANETYLLARWAELNERDDQSAE